MCPFHKNDFIRIGGARLLVIVVRGRPLHAIWKNLVCEIAFVNHFTYKCALRGPRGYA